MPVFASRAGRSAVLAVAALVLGTSAQALATSNGTGHVLPLAHTTSTAHGVCGAARPGYRACFAIVRPPVRATTSGTMTPQMETASTSLHGLAGGLTPFALQTAYGINPDAATTQTVAVVDAYDDPKIWWELNAFDKQYGLAPETTTSFTRVDQRGGRSFPSADAGWAVEEALDVEAVRAVCHRCRIRLVEADNSSSANLAIAVNRAVLIGAGVVSNSYGGPESAGESPSIRQAYTHPGVVITASTGDDGWYGWDRANDGEPAQDSPDVPAAYPDVVAVGGTKLMLNSNGTAYAERVWDRNGQADVYGQRWGALGASGGGCSRVYAAPAWQTVLSGYQHAGCLTGKRMVGDVAADADPNTGMDIYTLYGTDGVWETVGGTSLASPLIAGMWGLAGGAPGMQHPAQRLYDNQRLRPGSYYDVTMGSNGFCGAADVILAKSSCSVSLYSVAGTGNPNNLAFADNTWTGTLDCGWRFDGTAGTLSNDRQCRAGVGYDGPSGIGTPRSVQLFQPTPPTATLTAAGAPAGTPVSVQATGQVSASGDTLKQCSIAWGDKAVDVVSCSAGTAVTASHSYAAPGTYPVTFTVLDAYGQKASATQSVTVTAAP